MGFHFFGMPWNFFCRFQKEKKTDQGDYKDKKGHMRYENPKNKAREYMLIIDFYFI